MRWALDTIVMKNIISNRALWALLCFATLAGCAAQVPGPSVPFRAGANLDAARGAFDACTGAAERSGQNTLAGHYVGSVLWGGVIVGPIVVASNAPNLRYTGEVSGMDRCRIHWSRCLRRHSMSITTR